jgi:hypothetical protein
MSPQETQPGRSIRVTASRLMLSRIQLGDLRLRILCQRDLIQRLTSLGCRLRRCILGENVTASGWGLRSSRSVNAVIALISLTSSVFESRPSKTSSAPEA